MRTEEDTLLNANQVYALAEKEQESWQVGVISTAVAVVAIVLLSGITYCGSRPSVLDPEKQAQRTSDARNMALCVAKGGSWIPVPNFKNSTTTTMSCVTESMKDVVKARDGG